MKEPVRYSESYYLVYKNGNVYSEKTNKFIKPINMGGYLQYDLKINKIQVRILKHRLIAICYIPNPHNYPIVRHLNDVKSDCSLNNLCWGSYRDNMKDAIKNGKWVNGHQAKGEQQHSSKLKEYDIYVIKYLFKMGFNYADISRQFSVSAYNINLIIKNKTWKHLL